MTSSHGPDRWSPHATLSIELKDDRLFRAAEIVSREASLPLLGRIEKLILVEFFPIRQIGCCGLGG